MRKLFCAFVLSLFAVTFVQAQFDYQKVIKKYVEKQIKNSPCALDKNFKEFKKWQVLDYATNNFGMLTVYSRQADGSYSFVSDMWKTLQYNTAEIPADYPVWFVMDDYPAPGGNGPQIVITDDKDRKKLGLGFVFPKLLSAMGLDVGFDKDRTTVVNLTTTGFDLRCLRSTEANPFLRGDVAEKKNGRFVNPDIKDHFKNRADLAIVVGDVILKNMVITVKPDLNTTTKIEGKFGSTADIPFTDAEIKFGYHREQSGEYKFTISSPVIIARLIKAQPSAGASGSATFYETWDAINNKKVPVPKIH